MQNAHVLRQGSHLVGQRRDTDREMKTDGYKESQAKEKKCRGE